MFLLGSLHYYLSIMLNNQEIAAQGDLLSWLAWVDTPHSLTSIFEAWNLEGYDHPEQDVAEYQHIDNHLTAVRQLSFNKSFGRVLLWVWLLFLGACLAAVAIYKLCMLARKMPSAGLLKSCWRPSKRLQVLVSTTFLGGKGLGGLAFYYYDLVTSIIVMVQVWGRWPGYALLAILLCHLAVTGLIVGVYALHRFLGIHYDLEHTNVYFALLMTLLGLASSPVMIPVVLILDTAAVVRQVYTCFMTLVCSVHALWATARSCFPGCQQFTHSGSVRSLYWVDLENHESMHNLIAALLQSLPTVILNSVLFSLGNKPSHGIFLSGELFIAAILASCLAMLKRLVVVLWEAYSSQVHPVELAMSTGLGKNLSSNKATVSDENPVRVSNVELLAQGTVSSSAELRC